jgi:hypothetical protein
MNKGDNNSFKMKNRVGPYSAQGHGAPAWWPACAVWPTGVAGLGGPGARCERAQAPVSVASATSVARLPLVTRTMRSGAVASASLREWRRMRRAKCKRRGLTVQRRRRWRQGRRWQAVF